MKTKKQITHLTFEGIQIKSERIFHEFAAALDTIEENCGVHSCRVELKNIFFCPWINKENCRQTPMEIMLIELIDSMG